MKPVSMLGFALLLSATNLGAQSLPAVNLGATSFMDGAPPAGPGFYASTYLQYRQASEFKDASGSTLPLPNPQLKTYSAVFQGIYLWDHELPWLHAKPAVDVLLPLVNIDLKYGAPGPFPRATSGFGDLTFGPALQFDPIMGEHGPIFVQRLEFQVIAPTGRYTSDREINPGSGFFSIDPYWAGTLFLGPRFVTSFRAHYLWNAENDDPAKSLGPGVTSSQAGQAFHINFTLDAEIFKGFRAGLNGYWLRQLTSSKINGGSIAGLEQTLGLGPGVLYSFGPNDHLFGNAYFETEVRNRPEGWMVNLHYVHHF